MVSGVTTSLPHATETLHHRHLVEHVGVETRVGPLAEVPVFGVLGIGENLQQILVAADTPAVLGRAR